MMHALKVRVHPAHREKPLHLLRRPLQLSHATAALVRWADLLALRSIFVVISLVGFRFDSLSMIIVVCEIVFGEHREEI